MQQEYNSLYMNAANSRNPETTLLLLTNYAPFLFVLSIVLGLTIHLFHPIPLAFRSNGIALIQIIGMACLLGATILFVAVHRVRKIFFSELYEAQVCTDIRRGPYKRSRHPGALSLILLLFGVSLIINSLALFIFGFVLLAVFTWIIHPFQEKLLVEKCGDMYREYQKKVRMWF